MAAAFRFHSEHRLDAPCAAVFAVLHDVEAWPSWWPQIRSVDPYDDISGRVEIRSLLPVTLRLNLIAQVDDESTGTLQASLDGDLAGWTRFVVRPGGAGTALTYEQYATVEGPSYARRLAGPLRPLLVANHRLMMRSGVQRLERRAREAAAT
ncbi:SRPBCC family protein [Calidifontibacter terrae]